MTEQTKSDTLSSNWPVMFIGGFVFIILPFLVPGSSLGTIYQGMGIGWLTFGGLSLGIQYSSKRLKDEN